MHSYARGLQTWGCCRSTAFLVFLYVSLSVFWYVYTCLCMCIHVYTCSYVFLSVCLPCIHRPLHHHINVCISALCHGVCFRTKRAPHAPPRLPMRPYINTQGCEKDLMCIYSLCCGVKNACLHTLSLYPTSFSIPLLTPHTPNHPLTPTNHPPTTNPPGGMTMPLMRVLRSPTNPTWCDKNYARQQQQTQQHASASVWGWLGSLRRGEVMGRVWGRGWMRRVCWHSQWRRKR